jgi:isopenicillin N synthase-like dioxygenase
VINHGIPEHMTEGALEMAKDFFSLPIEAKMEVGAQSFEIFDHASIQHSTDLD